MKTKVLVLSIAIWSGAAIGAEATGFQKPDELSLIERLRADQITRMRLTASWRKPPWTILPQCKDELHMCWTRKDYENGVYYIGEWKAGKRHGLGKLSTVTSSTSMIGLWREDMIVSSDQELTGRLADVMLGAENVASRLEEAQRALRLTQEERHAHYAFMLRGRIRANTSFNTSELVEGNPRAEFHVTLSPECEVLDVRLKSSSGHTGWDRAAEFSIRSSSPFPKPPSGACPGAMLISHQPKEK